MGEDIFSEDDLDHRRGKFLAIPVGVSFGGGQTVSTHSGFCGTVGSGQL